MASEQQATWQLPLLVAGPIDVGRLLREVRAIDEFLMQTAIRAAGTQPSMPKASRLMEEITQLNRLNLLVEADRKRLIEFLQVVKDRAPVLHISFSADPSPLFVQKIMTWLRTEIHPLVLISIGLQPNIGAGCVVRTSNRFFDFSLKERFEQNRHLLIKQLAELNKAETAAEVQA
jgi:hypothetical protein